MVQLKWGCQLRGTPALPPGVVHLAVSERERPFGGHQGPKSPRAAFLKNELPCNKFPSPQGWKCSEHFCLSSDSSCPWNRNFQRSWVCRQVKSDLVCEERKQSEARVNPNLSMQTVERKHSEVGVLDSWKGCLVQISHHWTMMHHCKWLGFLKVFYYFSTLVIFLWEKRQFWQEGIVI